MALLDKVKSQAKDLKGKVEGKVEDVQAKRKVDDLLDDLGRILYAERTERPMADAEIEISRLVGELKTLEDEGAEVLPAS
jgi:polyhydroxyalkanoate synthesis regulator phasin